MVNLKVSEVYHPLTIAGSNREYSKPFPVPHAYIFSRRRSIWGVLKNVVSTPKFSVFRSLMFHRNMHVRVVTSSHSNYRCYPSVSFSLTPFKNKRRLIVRVALFGLWASPSRLDDSLDQHKSFNS